MRLAQKLAVGATGLVGLGIGSLGLGVAHAQTVTHTNPASVVTSPTSKGGADLPETATSTESDGPGGHHDPPGANAQFGAQSGPDTGGADRAANQ